MLLGGYWIVELINGHDAKLLIHSVATRVAGRDDLDTLPRGSPATVVSGATLGESEIYRLRGVAHEVYSVAAGDVASEGAVGTSQELDVCVLGEAL